jgi:hypothetical protein
MTDPLDTLRKLKPVATVDPAALDRLLAATAATPPRRPRRTRLAVTAALLASGVAVAGATGMLPRSFTETLSFWQSETGGAVTAGNARRLAQQPGPDGQVLSVWSATGSDGTTCVSALYEPPGPLDRPAPADFHSAGGQCSPAAPEPFGNLGGSATEAGVHTMWATAGPAVRAELHLPDGSRRPAVPAAGFFFCWYAAGPGAGTPLLVGYDAGGQVVGTEQMPNLSR